MSTFLELTKKDLIIKRSGALQKARSFFYKRYYLEVDCPLLSPFAALDNHIDLLKTDSKIPYYLHSSPEYGMKKLLSDGAPSIFQISHVFRADEKGSKHAQEFSMAEFYKIDIPYSDFIEETLLFIKLFTGERACEYFSYRAVFETYLGLNPYTEIEAIKQQVEQKLGLDTFGFTDDDILTTAMSALIEPLFTKDHLVIVTDFPPSQAALATCLKNGENDFVAHRFEIYSGGLELANGYHELSCPVELEKRFEALNHLRTFQNKPPYPIDLALLEAMKSYFPPCCGVACGFDRLLMLEMGIKDISLVQSLPSV